MQINIIKKKTQKMWRFLEWIMSHLDLTSSISVSLREIKSERLRQIATDIGRKNRVFLN